MTNVAGHVPALAAPMALSYLEQNSEQIETVRKFFPETWIWQLFEVGLVNPCTLVCCTALQSN